MKQSTKILLGVFGGFALIFLLVVAVGIYWFSTSGKQYFKGLVESADKHIAEGKEYGKTKDDHGCLDEAIERINRANSMSGYLAAHFFFQGCLESCKKTPEFCRDVPAESEIINSVKWTLSKCKELGSSADDQNCKQLVKAMQKHCDRERKKTAENN